MNGLKQTAIALLENGLLKTGKVLDVRYWEPSTFLEIDLHLPGLDMSDWELAQHIKCRVGPLTYRDYSLAGWDEETHTATLYIDAGHDGPGSRWAQLVKPGDTIQYAGCGRSHHAPVVGTRLIFLGDESSVGHFLSLQQLLPHPAVISGAILLAEAGHRQTFYDFLRLPIDPVCSRKALSEWVGDTGCVDDETVFYVMGNTLMVQEVRKTLKEKGVERKGIKVQGFWH